MTVINKSAETLLGVAGHVVGQPLSTMLPEFTPVFKTAIDSIYNMAEDQINLETSRGTRNLDVRISSYKGERTDTGWVITFDDMTRLVAAQRHSAWRDVARRIAHEIKNPLTPIQLSAERLERKYGKEKLSDPDVFANCTQTILRQVSNLGRMVDEFSAFARMPAPQLQSVNFEIFMQGVLFAQRVAFPDIEFVYESKADKETETLCDERLISQALTNIYKNAGEAITRRIDEAGQDLQDGRIETRVSVYEGMLCLDIIDNGPGWPVTNAESLVEPYITTRSEGTGLGLAIVKRIAEDHGGELNLFDMREDSSGAHVQFCLPVTNHNLTSAGQRLADNSNNLQGAKT